MNIKAEVLQKAINCVSGERCKTHGGFHEQHEFAANLVNNYFGINLNSHDISILMILLKLSRIKCGGLSEDHYVDIAGYSAGAYECRKAVWDDI